MAVKLGMNCAMYYGVAGSTASTLVENVKDVTLNLTKGEADVTTRGNAGWKATLGTLRDGSVDFDIVWDSEDPFFAALFAAWVSTTPVAVALLVLDDTIANAGQGLDADFSVINLTRTENLADAVMATVSVKPTYSTRAPAWYPSGS